MYSYVWDGLNVDSKQNCSCQSVSKYVDEGCRFLFLSGKMKIVFQATGRTKRGWGVDNRGRGGGMGGG
jgi:hypothetical protein